MNEKQCSVLLVPVLDQLIGSDPHEVDYSRPDELDSNLNASGGGPPQDLMGSGHRPGPPETRSCEETDGGRTGVLVLPVKPGVTTQEFMGSKADWTILSGSDQETEPPTEVFRVQ